jgi:hypothetical protein
MQVEDLKIRVPSSLKMWLRERAQQNSRTMNGEIVALLKAIKEDEIQRTTETKRIQQ